MPRPHIAMRKIRDVIRLSFGEGLSLRQVSASLGIPFTTVADHVLRAKDAGLAWPLPDGLDDDALEQLLFPPPVSDRVTRPLPDWKYMDLELRQERRDPAAALARVPRSIPTATATASSPPLPRLEPPHRRRHAPGAPGRREAVRRLRGRRRSPSMTATGEVRSRPSCSSPSLGASNYIFAEASLPGAAALGERPTSTPSNTSGAVPSLVCDNLRSGVTRPHRYEPDVNATYPEMAAHYGVAVMPARAYKPRDKAKVEVGVQLGRALDHRPAAQRHFFSLAETNAAIAARRVDQHPPVQQAGRLAARPVRGTRAPPCGPARRALRVPHLRQAKVHIDYHVELGPMATTTRCPTISSARSSRCASEPPSRSTP